MINSAWDEKVGMVLSAEAKPEMLETLAKQAPVLRSTCDDQRASARHIKTLGRLARHPYGAIRGVAQRRTLIRRRWHCSLATAASRFGIWWRSIPTRLRCYGANCGSVCKLGENVGTK
jgi:hypothetical protein